MAELRHDREQDFWHLVARNRLDEMSLGSIAVDEASKDPDLLALYELRILTETTAVSSKRAELIEELIDDTEGTQQLYSEIQHKYHLDDEQMNLAMRSCEQGVRHRQYGDIEWME